MVNSPRKDAYDNNGDGPADTAGIPEDAVYGSINPSTAPAQVLACLPSLAMLPKADRDKIAREIVNYRDLLDGTGANDGKYASNTRATVLGVAGLRNEPGFATSGEIMLPLIQRASKNDITQKLPYAVYTGGAPANYWLASNDGGSWANPSSDDGLREAIPNDITKYLVYYAWMSNHLTVRSDTYIAYIRVQLGDSTNSVAYRSYVAVLDRSNVFTPDDQPQLLMFAEIQR